MRKGHVIAVSALILLVVGGYFGYRYAKFHPPTWLIKLVTSTTPAPPLPEGDLAPISVPDGFRATIFARDILGARVMTRDPKGALLVSETAEGKIVALPDLNSDHKADKTVTVLSGLKQPHGITVICPYTGNASADQDECILYVAETDAVKAYSYDADTYTAKYQKTLAPLPSGGGHFTRTLLPHPDGKHLLVSIGSSCNVCEEDDARRASVQAIDLTTGEMKPFAIGLRNTVFMATDYVTGDVWGTDMGRDLIGDDIPPEEINILKDGGDYGWPICYGQNINDRDFDRKQYIRDPCADKVPPHIEMQAHSAPLGIAFIPEEGWPDGWGNDILVAFHGSWNRSEPTGYKVVHIHLDEKRNFVSQSDFLTGFLPAGGGGASDTIGRPAGILAEPGGTTYVSDDRAGAIYRVARTSLD
jgi:glucose/arabinose dehydrogenase